MRAPYTSTGPMPTTSPSRWLALSSRSVRTNSSDSLPRANVRRCRMFTTRPPRHWLPALRSGRVQQWGHRTRVAQVRQSGSSTRISPTSANHTDASARNSPLAHSPTRHSSLATPTDPRYLQRDSEWSEHGAATQTQPTDDSRDLDLLAQLARARRALVEQIGRRIIGQHKIVDDLVSALLAGGHALLVGVPGLAKTLLVQTVAQALDLSFSSRPTSCRATS